jgi:hypothetical protein
MTLLMVMTVRLLVYAALEYRIYQAFKDHEAAFPSQTGTRIRNPTARWEFSILWAFTCCVSQASGRLHSMLLRNIGTCFASLFNRTCGFMTSDIRKNHKGGAKCRLYVYEKILMA